jgi:hypothetical protein
MHIQIKVRIIFSMLNDFSLFYMAWRFFGALNLYNLLSDVINIYLIHNSIKCYWLSIDLFEPSLIYKHLHHYNLWDEWEIHPSSFYVANFF